MTTCETMAPLLVSRPLGLLEPEAEALVVAHLPGCGRCEGFAREAERALAAASLPAVAAGDPAGDPPGWAALSARLATRPAPRRWLPAVGLLVIGSVVGAAALWPSPPIAAPPAPPPPRVAPAPPPPSEAPPPASEAPPPASEPPAPPSEPAPPAPPPPAETPRREHDSPVRELDATVLAVDPTKRVSVLLSVGQDDRVERGDRFEITRGGVVVGEVQVERVLRDSCGCSVISVRDGFELQPYDFARLAH